MKTLEIVGASEAGRERASTTIASPIGTIELIAAPEALVEVRLPGSRAEDGPVDRSGDSGAASGRVSGPSFEGPSADVPAETAPARRDMQEPDVPAETSSSPPLSVLDRAVRELRAYFRGDLREFTVPVALSGTRFQEQVWRGLLSIPYGERRSYGWLAEEIGRPTASRAVGAANGCNPVPIVVPCHRVIGADGSLVGYGGGLETKRWLLSHEAAQVELF